MRRVNIFLDTCIFFSYAYIFESFSDYSEKVFNNSEYYIYTSETVKEEISVRKERREKAYPLFLDELINGSNVEETYLKLGMYLTQNDLGHLHSLRDHLISTRPLSEILSEFRRWKKKSDARLRHAKSTIMVTVPRCTDLYMKDIIKSIIINDPDSKIVIEVFEWSKSVEDPKFITSDYTDIYKNRINILNKLVDYKYLEEIPFGIFHVVEFMGS